MEWLINLEYNVSMMNAIAQSEYVLRFVIPGSS